MAALQQVASVETMALDAAAAAAGVDWRTLAGRVVWSAYDRLDPDAPIVTLKKWVFSFTVRVRDVRPLLELLLGEAGA